MKLIVGISGASGTHLGVKLANIASNLGICVTAIITTNAAIAFKEEKLAKYLGDDKNSNIYDFLNKNIEIQNEISQSAASGSSLFDAMIITPCSTNSLCKIACGISDNLLTRAANVMLKERKKLVLSPRELPFSTLHLEHMSKLSMQGVVIAPCVIGYYSMPATLDELENFIIGKWLDVLNIQNNLFKRWKI